MSQANGAATIEHLQEQVERARLQRELKHEQVAVAVLESYFPTYGNDQQRLIPPRHLAEPDERAANAFVNAQDRRRGAHPVAYRTWDELVEIWAIGRWLADSNLHVAPVLTGLKNKVIAKGFTYRPVPRAGYEQQATRELIAQCQRELDLFSLANKWVEWERELFECTRVDGEAFLRFFGDYDVLQVRSLWPEQIPLFPDAGVDDPEWAWGIHVNPEDHQEVLGYWVAYDGDAQHGSEVPASEILHVKINVRRTVRRGLSDFFAIGETAEELRKLMRNMRRGASILSAIAWIEKHAKATKADVEAFATNVASETGRDRNGRLTRHEKIEPGTVIRTGAGKDYEGPPLATANTVNLLEIGRASRQALANRWNAPEVLTGDASNGTFSSLAIAESPFVAMADAEQHVTYLPAFKEVMLRALNHAESRGRLPAGTMRVIDVHVEPPPIVVRDKLQQAQTNEIEVRNGVRSPQTWAQEIGLDFDEEQKEIQKAKTGGWLPPAQPLPPAPLDPATGLGQFLAEGQSRPFPLWSRLTC